MSTIAAVFAHPDDETFICGGALARAAAEGHRVVLVCATCGEMGRRMGVPPMATRETIGKVREQELREACDALGIEKLYLLGLRDKTLEIQPFAALVDVVLRHLEMEQPDIVVTFHEKLGGHPDHCTIGAAATAAFETYRQSHRDARLFYVAWSGMADSAESFGLRKDQFIYVDVSQHLRPKMMAFRAHRTQSQMSTGLWGDEQSGMRSLGNKEYFIRMTPPFKPGEASLTD